MKLIDVLVMISKGELKEGTKVKVKGLDGFINEYKFVKNIEFVEDEPQKYDLQDSNGKYVFEDFYLSTLEDEVELIETIDNNTEKIEELDNYEWEEGDYDYQIEILYRKLNEVIRYINKEE